TVSAIRICIQARVSSLRRSYPKSRSLNNVSMHRLSSASATRGKTRAGACGQPATRAPGPVDGRAPGRQGLRSVELGCGLVQLVPPGATGIEGGLRLGDGLVIPTGPCGLELLLEFDARILGLAERPRGAGLRLRVAALPRSLLGLGQG